METYITTRLIDGLPFEGPRIQADSFDAARAQLAAQNVDCCQVTGRLDSEHVQEPV